MTAPNPIGQIGLEAQLLIELLDALEIGELCTYKTMDKSIGRDVREFARGALSTATRRLRRDRDKVFGCVTKKGYKRLNDEEILVTGESRLKAIRRRAKVTAEILSKASGLDQEGSFTRDGFITVAATVAHFTKKPSMDRVRTAIADTKNGALPVGRVTQLFS